MHARLRFLFPAAILFSLLIVRPSPGAEKSMKLVMLGDSVTLGASAPKDKTIPALVETKLNTLFKGKIKWSVVNAGVGSETSQGALARASAVLAAHKPDYVSVSYGLNDAREKKAEWFRQQLTLLVDLIQKHPARPALFMLTASPFVNDKHAWGKDPFFVQKGGLDDFLDGELNAVTRRLATDRALPLCDMHRGFVSHGNWEKLLLPDGVHPNADGNEVAAEIFAQCFAAFIKARVLKDMQAVKQEKDLQAAVAAIQKAPRLTAANKKKTAATIGAALDKCPYLAEAHLLLETLVREK